MNVLEDHKYSIEKVNFGPIEPEYKVDGGRADLMVRATQGSPLLIIETKRKVQGGSGVTVFREFDPMSPRVITQALTYASLTGSSLFATTNGKVFALFLVPERGEPFRIDRHRLYIKEIQLKKETAEEILNLVARWKSGLKIEKTPVDWAFILRLRSFVNYLAKKLTPLVTQAAKADKSFHDRLAKQSGEVSEEDYAREAAYILMNKIIFHKILERYYGKLTKLHPLDKKSGKSYMAGLKERFVDAMVITKDFEPVFSTGIYDDCPLPDDEVVLDEINAFIDDMDTYKLEDIGSDVVGFIYERIIPPEERHMLGQFYTPPYIAELISKWAIRSADDKVLDPACGSGTFLVKAYSLLKGMKPLAGAGAHAELLEQVYGIDINPFPAHMTAVNLAMRDVSHPTSQMNVIVEDFFNIKPDHVLLSPFAIRTARGELRKETSIPHVDAIVANPPYTRWLEVSDSTKKAVDGVIGDTLRDYGLQARSRAGVETGIFMPFVVHGRDFLKEGGRLAMIISNSWLQTDVGINFTRYLLDNFKVHAVIDFATRVFDLPLVATTVILLEKCGEASARDQNQTTLLYVDTETKVEELLRAIRNPAKYEDRFTIATERQGGISRGEKLVNLMFGLNKLDRAFANMVKVKDIFDVSRGNIEYAAAKSRGLGSNEFFFVSQGVVDQWGLTDYTVPVATSPRYTKFYSFDKADWEQLRKKGTPSYLFLCRDARSSHRPSTMASPEATTVQRRRQR